MKSNEVPGCHQPFACATAVMLLLNMNLLPCCTVSNLHSEPQPLAAQRMHLRISQVHIPDDHHVRHHNELVILHPLSAPDRTLSAIAAGALALRLAQEENGFEVIKKRLTSECEISRLQSSRPPAEIPRLRSGQFLKPHRCLLSKPDRTRRSQPTAPSEKPGRDASCQRRRVDQRNRKSVVIYAQRIVMCCSARGRRATVLLWGTAAGCCICPRVIIQRIRCVITTPNFKRRHFFAVLNGTM